MTIFNLVSSLFITIGALSIIVGLLGVYRMPDFYTRLHAASIIDTLGAMLILLIEVNFNIGTLLILIFILITTPTAAHALAKSALHGNLKPILKDD